MALLQKILFMDVTNLNLLKVHLVYHWLWISVLSLQWQCRERRLRWLGLGGEPCPAFDR